MKNALAAAVAFALLGAVPTLADDRAATDDVGADKDMTTANPPSADENRDASTSSTTAAPRVEAERSTANPQSGTPARTSMSVPEESDRLYNQYSRTQNSGTPNSELQPEYWRAEP